MARGMRIAGVMAATLVMMTSTAAAITAVNVVVAESSRSTSDVVASGAVASDVALDVSAPVSGPVSLTTLTPLSDTPLPRINVMKLVQQVNDAAVSHPAAPYVAPAAVVRPTSHEGEREGEAGDERESDD